MLSLAKTLCSRRANRTLIPKYIRNARAKYVTLIVLKAADNSSIPTYHSSTANIAIMATICIKIFRNRLEKDFFGFWPWGVSCIDML